MSVSVSCETSRHTADVATSPHRHQLETTNVQLVSQDLHESQQRHTTIVNVILTLKPVARRMSSWGQKNHKQSKTIEESPEIVVHAILVIKTPSSSHGPPSQLHQLLSWRLRRLKTLSMVNDNHSAAFLFLVRQRVRGQSPHTSTNLVTRLCCS